MPAEEKGSVMATLLIVNGDRNRLAALEAGLRSETLDIVTAQTANQGLALVEERRPDAVLLDVDLPDLSGLDAFARIRALAPCLPVILTAASAATETTIEAIKRGAFEYLLEPVDPARLQEVVGRAVRLSRLRHVPADPVRGEQPDAPGDCLVGRSAAMQEVYKAIGRVAPLDLPVLVLGESGTGKELVARAVHQHSDRADRPFLAINCAAIPETLLESELFGHEKGAFTGADRRRIGKFEQANGGTIFLDEIGDMTAATQAKVLRLLQEQRFARLGGNETVQTDVRVIAATNQDLEAMVEAGRFRKDLFYRLNVFTIRLPALRERSEDLPLLIDHFAARVSQQLRRAAPSFSPEALRVLQAHDWPGNVRELQSTIKYALVLAAGNTVTPDCLPESVFSASEAPRPMAAAPTFDLVRFIRDLLQAGVPELYDKASSEFDRIVLSEVLRHVKGRQARASELLGICRNTLRSKLRALGLAVERQLEEADADDSASARHS
jgi:DNA-binding NtrC family response regulator